MDNPAQSSGLKNADAVISDRESYVHSIIVLTDGTNAATLTLYDNSSAASGTELAKASVVGTSLMSVLDFHGSIHANNGIFADVSGTGATYIVLYRKN